MIMSPSVLRDTGPSSQQLKHASEPKFPPQKGTGFTISEQLGTNVIEVASVSPTAIILAYLPEAYEESESALTLQLAL